MMPEFTVLSAGWTLTKGIFSGSFHIFMDRCGEGFRFEGLRFFLADIANVMGGNGCMDMEGGRSAEAFLPAKCVHHQCTGGSQKCTDNFGNPNSNG